MSVDDRYRVSFLRLETAMKLWESLDGPLINGRKAISEDLANAIEDAINDTSDVSAAGEPLVLAESNYEAAILWDQLADAYRDYKRRACAAVSLSEVEVDGDSTLWRCVFAS